MLRLPPILAELIAAPAAGIPLAAPNQVSPSLRFAELFEKALTSQANVQLLVGSVPGLEAIDAIAALSLPVVPAIDQGGTTPPAAPATPVIATLDEFFAVLSKASPAMSDESLPLVESDDLLPPPKSTVPSSGDILASTIISLQKAIAVAPAPAPDAVGRRQEPTAPVLADNLPADSPVATLPRPQQSAELLSATFVESASRDLHQALPQNQMDAAGPIPNRASLDLAGALFDSMIATDRPLTANVLIETNVEATAIGQHKFSPASIEEQTFSSHALDSAGGDLGVLDRSRLESKPEDTPDRASNFISISNRTLSEAFSVEAEVDAGALLPVNPTTEIGKPILATTSNQFMNRGKDVFVAQAMASETESSPISPVDASESSRTSAQSELRQAILMTPPDRAQPSVIEAIFDPSATVEEVSRSPAPADRTTAPGASNQTRFTPNILSDTAPTAEPQAKGPTNTFASAKPAPHLEASPALPRANLVESRQPVRAIPKTTEAFIDAERPSRAESLASVSRFDAAGELRASSNPMTFAPSSQADANASVLAQIDRVEFVSRLTQAMRNAYLETPKSIDLELHPPELGALRIHVTQEEGVFTARIETQSQAARTALLDHLSVLDRNLSQHGIQIQRFQVDQLQELPSSQGQGNHSSGSGADSGNPGGNPSRQHDAPRHAFWDARTGRREQTGASATKTTWELLAEAPGMNHLV